MQCLLADLSLHSVAIMQSFQNVNDAHYGLCSIQTSFWDEVVVIWPASSGKRVAPLFVPASEPS